MNANAKVGFVFILGVALMFLVSSLLKDGELSFSKKQGYQVHALFDSIAGIEPEAKVRVSGVDAGVLVAIELRDDGKVDVILEIMPHIILRAGAKASIKSRGLIGEKYFELSPGSVEEPILLHGDYLRSATGGADIDALATKLSGIADDVKAVTATLKETIGSQQGKKSISRILENVDKMTGSLRAVVEENRQGITAVVKNLQAMSANLDKLVKNNQGNINLAVANFKETSIILKEVAEQNQAKIAAMLSNFEHFSQNLDADFPKASHDLQQVLKTANTMLLENRLSLREGMTSLNSASAKMDKTMDAVDKITAQVASGDGTLGKLVFDESAYTKLDKGLTEISSLFEKMDRLQLYLGARTEYLQRETAAKTYFTIKIQPREDKFYLFEVVDNPRGLEEERTIKETITDGNGEREITTIEKRTTDDLKFTLQLGKRFYNVAIRGGIMESSGGMGADIYLLDDDLRFHVDIWDLTNKDPHLRVTGQYYFSDQVFMNIGGDDLASSDRMSFFLGAGFLFGDDDIKYLLNRIPIPAN